MTPTIRSLLDSEMFYELKESEQTIYLYVVNYQQQFGEWPGVEQIRRSLKLTNSGTIMSLLMRLQKQGAIKSSYRFRIGDMTSSQNAVYWFIVEYKKAHDGTSPTMREIMDGANYNSTSAVRRTLRQLHDMGLIKVDYPHVRTIRVYGGSYHYNQPIGAAA